MRSLVAVVAMACTTAVHRVDATLAAAVPAADAPYPSELDDHACAFSWTSKTCEPAAFCAYQFRLGDLTFDQSCRLVPDKFGRVPQQLHLAFAGAKAGAAMGVSWTTYAKVEDAAVFVGATADALARVPNAAVESRSYYEDGHYQLFNYHATVTGLKPHTQYFYRVGSAAEPAFQSAVHNFTTARAPDDATPFTVAVYGDFGVDDNAKATLQYVNQQLPGQVDFVYHIGDISYADNAFLKATELFGFFYEETYNRWMNTLAPVLQQVPYMVTVGNHEAECHSPACFLSGSKKDQLGNYTAYNARFQMPSKDSGGVQSMWYAFEHGPIHFTSISSETDFNNAPKNSVTGRKYGGFGDQLTWLEADLKKADANRSKVPWLVVGMHRAMYTRDSCDKEGKPKGISASLQQAFEALFIKYKVDVVVAGHVHLYERHFPIKNGKAIMAGVSEDKKTYKNPEAPVYLITGAAGNTEGHGPVNPKVAVGWNAFIENEHYGITLLNVTRKALKWSFVASDSGDVLDSFSIVKE